MTPDDIKQVEGIIARQNAAREELNRIGEKLEADAERKFEQQRAWRLGYVETRNKFMVLGAGIAGGVVPVLASSEGLLMHRGYLGFAAGCFIAQIAYGGVAHVLQGYRLARTILVLNRIHQASLRFNVANSLPSKFGIPAPGDLKAPETEFAALQEENQRFHLHGLRAFVATAVDDVIFYGLFVTGAINLLLAFGGVSR